MGSVPNTRVPKVKDFVPLAGLDELVFGGWDVFPDSCYDAAVKAGVLDSALLEEMKPSLSAIHPMPAVFERRFVKRLQGTYMKRAKTKMHLADQVIEDIERFKEAHDLSRLVMVWCGSTEVFLKPQAVHNSMTSFEKGLKSNSPHITPSMIYALCGAEAEGAVCQRRAEPDAGNPRACPVGGQEPRSDLAARLQDRSDAFKDHFGSGA